MKRKLLLLTMMLFLSIANAQHTWDFGNDTTNWPIAAVPPTVNFSSDGLACVVGGATSFGQIVAGAATFSAGAFGSDAFTAVNRFNTLGLSTVVGQLPSKRYVSFPVTGSCTVKLWMGATAIGRKASISDGTTLLGSYTTAAGTSPFPGVLTVTYTGAATTLYVYCDAAVYYYKLSWTPAGAASPTLTPDTTSNDVDNNLDITFTNDPTWFSAITNVTIGTITPTTLVAGTDYVLTAGNLQLLHTGPNASLINTAGSKVVTINAAGYAPAAVTQVINAGAPIAANSTATISPALDNNTTSTITCTARDQYNNLVAGYAFKFDVTRTNNNVTTNELYTVNGVPYTTNATGVATPATNASGVATFTAELPATINVNDGVSIQVKLANGTTNVGSAFIYINTLLSQTITFAPLSPVAFGSGNFNLTATASSGLAVSYTSDNPLVATVSGSTVTIVGVGTTSITASQNGNGTYDAAIPVSRDLEINCASTSTNTTTISACGSYTWANTGQTYTTSGVYPGTTTNCTTESLNLTINGSTNVTTVTQCSSYTWADTGLTYTVSGIYNGTTTACVLEQLNLTINATTNYYADGDNDGVGAGAATAFCSATPPPGYSATSTDCNDADTNVWQNGSFYVDVDLDGYTDIAQTVCYGATIPSGYYAAASSPSKLWNFSNTATWPLSAGIGVTDIVTDQLGIYPLLLSATTNMGAITANTAAFPATATTAAFTSVNRFQLNGSGSTTTYLPSQRYVYFDVSGPCRVLVWFRTGGAGTRTMFVTDGTNLIGSLASSSTADFNVLKVNYTGGSGRLYIYGDQSCNLFKIEVTGATITTPLITPAPTNFVADTTLNDFDHDLDITFTDNPTWRSAVYAVRIATTTLVPGTDYDLTAGLLKLKPSGGNPALTTPGTDKKVNLLATNYSSSSTGVLQTILAGAPKTINLKLFVEGYYLGGGFMNTVQNNQDYPDYLLPPNTNVENVTVELHKATSPYALVATATTMLKTDGTAISTFPTTPSGSYYIAVKTKSAVQTWSALPQTVDAVPLDYDFTTSASQAFFDNMKEVETGVWAFFSGDILGAQDDEVNPTDYSVWEADANGLLFGSYPTDLNGDGEVNPTDYSIWEANANGFVFGLYPTP